MFLWPLFCFSSSFTLTLLFFIFTFISNKFISSSLSLFLLFSYNIAPLSFQLFPFSSAHSFSPSLSLLFYSGFCLFPQKILRWLGFLFLFLFSLFLKQQLMKVKAFICLISLLSLCFRLHLKGFCFLGFVFFPLLLLSHLLLEM